MVGLPILDQVPFSGLEPTPKLLHIANALHLQVLLVQANITTKKDPITQKALIGLPTKFLYQQALTFADAGSNDAFHTILALLIYGLLLFPNIKNFIDIHDIQIFLTKNAVPTLLANTYHSIHDHTSTRRGTIICCTPLLYKWFVSHLPQTRSRLANPDNLPWSQKIMSLTPSDIVWYNPVYNTGKFIFSCGEYPNVPLIGMYGGITYNLVLAKRQFGYPMKTKPAGLQLTSEFYSNHEDHSNKRGRFLQAWRAIERLSRIHLGNKSDLIDKSYTQWVIERAAMFGMPYHMTRLVSSTVPSSSLPTPSATKAKFQESLAEVAEERNAWKRKYEEFELRHEALKGELEIKKHELLAQSRIIVQKTIQLQDEDAALRSDPRRRKRNMDMFFGPHSDLEDPLA
ncbi:hypothetical protein QL285_008731 [Trifolium repens]|nr:hypothetical protein QL285_008731 [Trifolium repens]